MRKPFDIIPAPGLSITASSTTVDRHATWIAITITIVATATITSGITITTAIDYR